MFSWSKGHKTTAYPGGRASNGNSATSGISRDEHVQSYINDGTLKPSTRRVSADDSTYDTVFQTKSGHALILRVHMPPGTTPKAPAMTLVGVRAQHAWLDHRMHVTGYHPISSDSVWTSSGLKLGAAVNAVVQHLQLNPPTSVEITDESLKRIQASISQPAAEQQQQQHGPPDHQPPPYAAANGGSSGNSTEQPPDYNTVLHAEEDSVETSHMPIPSIPASFPELESMSTKDMQELLEDEDKFRIFVEEMSSVTNLVDLQSSIRKGNIETAKANLKQEEELTMLRAEVATLQSDLRDKVETFKGLEAKQTQLCAPPDRRNVIQQLTAAKKESYAESEEIASDWVDDGGDVNGFIDKFTEKRKVHHSRAAKLERLNAMPP